MMPHTQLTAECPNASVFLFITIGLSEMKRNADIHVCELLSGVIAPAMREAAILRKIPAALEGQAKSQSHERGAGRRKLGFPTPEWLANGDRTSHNGGTAFSVSTPQRE